MPKIGIANKSYDVSDELFNLLEGAIAAVQRGVRTSVFDDGTKVASPHAGRHPFDGLFPDLGFFSDEKLGRKEVGDDDFCMFPTDPRHPWIKPF